MFALRAFRARTYAVLDQCLAILGWALIAVLLLVLLVVLMQFMGIVAWLILFFVLVEGWRKYRATQQYGLLWLLTVSAERSMPLGSGD